jgi:hypothetical protein
VFCSLSNTVCNAHVQCYIAVCVLSGCTVFFPHYLINCTTFRRKKKGTEHKMCVLIFSSTLSKPFLVIRITWRDSTINRHALKWSTRYYCQILIKFEFPGQIFERKTQSNFTKTRPVGGRVIQCGQTDRQTGMTELIAAFRNFANVSKNYRRSRSSIL